MFEILQTINTGKENPILTYGQPLECGDKNAHSWLVRVYDKNDMPVDLTGMNVIAYFSPREIEKSFSVHGTVQSNVAKVILDEKCYAVPGRLTGVLQVSNVDDIVTVAIAKFRVIEDINDQIVDTGDPIDNVQDLLAQIEAMKSATKAATDAAIQANLGAESANTAAEAANTAAGTAGLAANSANNSAELAKTAASNADEAAKRANTAAETIETATGAADEAAERANAAAAMVDENLEKVETDIASAGNVQIAAIEQQGAAQAAAIENKGANTLAGIPEDYTKIDADVKALKDTKADAIVCEASGSVITLDDASDLGLHGLRIFGKTTQDGTPTPDAPVPLVTAGADGGIEIGTYGKNLLKASAGLRTMTKNGLTFTPAFDGNGELVSVTVNGTATARADYTVLLMADGPDWMSRFDGMTVIGSGCPAGGSSVPADGLYMLAFQGFDTDAIGVSDAGNGTPHVTVAEDIGTFKTVQVYIVIFAGCIANNLVFKPMIRRADENDGTFEPYKGQTAELSTPNGLPGIPVTSGGNYTDENGQQWWCDEVDLERGVYVQRVGILPGSKATWNESQSCWEWKVNDVRSEAYSSRIFFEVLCNIAFFSTTSTQGTCRPGTMENAGTIVLFVPESTNIGAVELYYQKEPVETPISDAEIAAYKLLHTNKPNTTIYNDAGAWQTVEYAADTKRYIDKKISELVTLALANS